MARAVGGPGARAGGARGGIGDGAGGPGCGRGEAAGLPVLDHGLQPGEQGGDGGQDARLQRREQAIARRGGLGIAPDGGGEGRDLVGQGGGWLI